MSPVLGRRPRAPRSCPVNQEAKAPGRGRQHGDGRADQSTESNRTGGGAAHQRRATKNATEALPRTTTTAQRQVPGNNGHRVPETRAARPACNEPRHEKRCQAPPHQATRTPKDTPGAPTRRSARKAARKEGSAGTHTRTPHPQSVGSSPWPYARRTGGRVRESARPRTTLTTALGTTPARPPACPTARTASLQEHALWGR